MRAMLEWPIPKTLRELRGFLGLTGYYQRFIRGYAHIEFHLTQQPKKDCFTWCEMAQQAFKALKLALTHCLGVVNAKFCMTVCH